MSTKRWSKGEAIKNFPSLETWPTVASDLVPPSIRENFANNCNAVSMYLKGVSTDEIFSLTGIRRSRLPIMSKRCLELASDGQIMGFRALLPFTRIKAYDRQSEVKLKLPQQKGGHAGALGATLSRFPDIWSSLVTLIKKEAKHQQIHEHKIRATTLHKIFLDYLKEKGVTKREWPFNTTYLGVTSIQRFMKEILDANFDRSVNTREERSAKAHLSVGRGVEPLICFEEPFDAVELDAYSINAFLSVVFSTPEEAETNVLLERLWLIALIDRQSTTVLGHTVVYSSEISADDVIRVIRDAVSKKWQPKNLTVKGLSYPDQGGIPSGVIPDCFGAVWGCILLDGALAHLAKSVRETARKALGFSINWGPVGHFERRPNVERLFKSLSDNVFQRFPSTTGSNPGKGRADKAEEKAVQYNIRAEEVEELIDVYFAQFNATPTEGLSFLTPLEFIRQFTESQNKHFLVRHLPQSAMTAYTPIPCMKECTVRGGRKIGRKPYIEIDRVRYTSYLLGQMGALVGKKIVAEIDEDDMRQVRAFMPNGAELGFLKAGGRWSITKHSRKTRKAINRLIHRRILVLSEFDDPVQCFLRYLSVPAKKTASKELVPTPSNAVEAARVGQESNLPLMISKPAPNIPPPINISTRTDGGIMDAPSLDINKLINRKR